MRYVSLSGPAALLLSASLLAQVQGESPAPPQIPGTAPPSIVVGPQYLTGTVPAANRTAWGNTSDNIPISWSLERYQQVFLGSELPKAFTIRGLGFRHDEAVSHLGYKGQTVEMEITLAYTKKTPANLTWSFASNFDVTTPAPIIVVPRTRITLPNFASTKQTNLQWWQVQIPFKVPFVWAQVAGRNMLVQIRIFGNTNGNRIFTYPLDAASGSSVTTTRLFGTGPLAKTGTLSRNHGLVMSFLDEIKSTASYTTFGKGCPGTGGNPGIVLPNAYVSKMGNSNNNFGVASANQRYQQVFAGAQVGKANSFLSHSLRMHNAKYAGGSQTLEIKVSSTTKTPATLSTTFASNITSKQTIVFTKKIFLYPKMVPTLNPASFGINFKWDRIFVWTAPKGQSMLMEILNTSITGLSYSVDAAFGDTNVATVWGTGPTATIGSKGSNFGLVMKIHHLGMGNLTPVLSNSGTPILGKAFAVTLSSAKANTAAALILGASNNSWGPVPLPLDLSPLGAKGCPLLVSPLLFTGLGVDIRGTAAANILIPNINSLIGIQWYNQFFVFDSGANGLGMAFTNGGTGKIGDR